MTLRKEVLDILNDEKWRKMCYKFVGQQTHFVDDLYQEWALVVLEYPPHKIDELIKKDLLELWCYRVLRNLWHSVNSRFYYKYRKVHVLDVDRYIDTNFDDRTKEQVLLYNDLMETFTSAYNEAKKFVRDNDDAVSEMLTRIYIDINSFRKMQDELGINHQTCYRYVDRFRDTVKRCYYKLPMADDTNT